MGARSEREECKRQRTAMVTEVRDSMAIEAMNEQGRNPRIVNNWNR
jgi:hypothetical protein